MTPCVEWEGTRFRDGYGREGDKLAHRLVYELVHGPIPKGLIIRHKCDNPPCVNPDHLEMGTHKDNMNDKMVRGRANSPRGTRQPGAKLTEELVRIIRNEVARGTSQAYIAAQLDVSRSLICRVMTGRAWAYVK